MLSQILLRHMLRTWVTFVGPVAVLTAFLFGFSPAVGVVVGAALIAGAISGLVLSVQKLLDPTESSGRKAGLSAILMLKMVIIAGLLWLFMGRWGVSPLGILIGLGLGLVSSLVGLNAGAASSEGKRAIDEAEARIREEEGDRDDESR